MCGFAVAHGFNVLKGKKMNKIRKMIGSMTAKFAALLVAFACAGNVWGAETTTIQNAAGEDITVYVVADGFYQDGEDYDKAKNFYITNLTGLKYFRDWVNGTSAAMNHYYDSGFLTLTLASFASNNGMSGKNVHLLADIDLTGEVWQPIGSGSGKVSDVFANNWKAHFYGNFYGHNHVVSNMDTSASEQGDKYSRFPQGFFGQIASNGIVIDGLILENVKVVSNFYYSQGYAGAIVGDLGSNACTISGCVVRGTIEISAYHSGAIYGIGNSNIVNCKVIADEGSSIDGYVFAGGLVGAQRCSATSSLNITGNTVSGVEVTSYRAGSLVGAMALDAKGSCSVTGNDVVDCIVNGDAATVETLLGPTTATTVMTVENNTVRTTLIVETGDLTPEEEITPTTTEVNYTVPVTVKDRSGNVVSETTAQEIAVSVADADIANTTLASVKIGDVVAKAVESVGEDATSVTAIEIQVKASTEAEGEVQAITYEVHPEAVVTVTKTVEQAQTTTESVVELSNTDLAADAVFTFDLDVSSITGIAVGDKVRVTHSWEAYTDAAGNSVAAGSETTLAAVLEGKKVRITTTHFSTWTLEGITIDSGTVAVVFAADGTPTQYTTLAAATAAAYDLSGDVTVQLIANAAESATICQKAGQNLTVNGGGNTLTGQLIVLGLRSASDATRTETLTIKNFNFTGADDKSDFKLGDAFVYFPSQTEANTDSVSKPLNYVGSSYVYAHNVTIADCSFRAADNDNPSTAKAVAIKSLSTGLDSIKLKNIDASYVHSIQFFSVQEAELDGVTLANTKNGINFNFETAGVATIRNSSICPVEAEAYGIRIQGAGHGVINLLEGTVISAYSAFETGNTSTITISSDGTINVKAGSYKGLYTTSKGNYDIVVTGGLFENDPSDYVAEGYKATALAQSSAEYAAGYRYTIGECTYVAQVVTNNGATTNKYEDLHKALEAGKAAGSVVTLLADVDLNNEPWTPISGFGGTFDGANHSISNLYINLPNQDNVGLFDSGNGIFRNFTIVNATVTGKENVAAVFGRTGGAGFLAENVSVTGRICIQTSMTSGYGRVGGIAGGWVYGRFINCSVIGDGAETSFIKSCDRYAGGIVGHADDVREYTNCTVKNIKLSAKWLCGGIAGPGPAYSTTTGCSVDDVVIDAYASGGLFGWIFTYSNQDDEAQGVIDDCSVSDVTFTSDDRNGGIGGYSISGSDAKGVVVKNISVSNVSNANDNDALLTYNTTIVRNSDGTEDVYYYATMQNAVDNIKSDDEVVTVLNYTEGMVAPEGWDFKTENDVTTLVKVVAQVGDQKFETLAEAIAAANDGDTVTLLADTAVADTITINKSMTLDLNGKTITNTSTGKRPFYVVTEDPNSVVETTDEEGNVVFEGATTLTVEGNGGSLVIPDGGTAYGFFDIAKPYTGIVINGGTISGDGGNGSLIRYGVDAGYGQRIALNNVTGITKSRMVSFAAAYHLWDIKVIGGTYTHNNYRNYNGAFLKNSFEFLTQNGIFDGVTITSDEGSCVCCGGSHQENMVFRNNTFTVKEKSIISDPWNNAAIAVQTAGSLTIESGTYTSAGIYGVATANSGATINIEGGTITGADYGVRIYGGGFDPDTTLNISGTASVTGGQAGVYVLEIGNGNGTATANINGGTIAGGITIDNKTATPSRATVEIEDGEVSGTLTDASPSGKSGVYSVSGGVFSSQVPAEYCTADYSPIANTDSETSAAYPYTVASDYEAQIVREGVVQQKGTLTAVVAAAESGDTVMLLKDVEIASKVQLNKEGSYTIDGNGFAIKMAEGATFDGNGILIFGPAGVDANYDLAANIAAKQYALKNATITGFNAEIIRCEGCSLTLEGCTFTGNNITENLGRGKHMLRLSKSAVTMTGCTVSGNTASQVVYYEGDSGSLAPLVVTDSLFTGNTLNSSSVILIADSASAGTKVQDSTFADNTIDSSGNVAVVYCSGPAEVSGNLFSGNSVATSAADKREGVVVLGGDAGGSTIAGNAFVGNTLGTTATDYATVWVNDKYDDYAFDVSGNYWGDGEAPDFGSGKDVYQSTEKATVAMTGYATAYTTVAGVNGATVTVKNFVAQIVETGVKYENLMEAIDAAYNGGTVELLTDVTVNRWHQNVWSVEDRDDLTYSGNRAVTGCNGLTINGNGHSLTINSIDSGTNGNQIFRGSRNLTVSNITINAASGVNGIGLKSGLISDVTFNMVGSNPAIYTSGSAGCEEGEHIEIRNCTFNTEAADSFAIYSCDPENGVDVGTVISGNTFNTRRSVALRSDMQFLNNTVNGEKGVTVAGGSTAVVSGNYFAETTTSRSINVYPSNATIENNVILGPIELEDKTYETAPDLSGNYWGGNAPANLPEGVVVNSYYATYSGYDTPPQDGSLFTLSNPVVFVAQNITTGVKYATLAEAVAEASAGDTVKLLADITYGTGKEVEVWDKAVNLDLGGFTLETKSVVSTTAGNDGYKAAAICYTIEGSEVKQVTVGNGTLVTAYGAGVYADGTGLELTLTNLTVRAGTVGTQTTKEYSSAVRITGNAKVVIESGTYTGPNAIAVSNSGGRYVINGGDFVGDLYISSYANPGVAQTVEIADGTFKGNFVKGNGEFTISGGYFSAPVLEEYCASGYIPTTTTAPQYAATTPYTVINTQIVYPTGDTEAGQATVGVPVPYSWITNNTTLLPKDRVPTADEFAAVTKAALEAPGANGVPLWQSYVLGFDPSDPSSNLRMVGVPVDGEPGKVMVKGLNIDIPEDLAVGTIIGYHLEESVPGSNVWTPRAETVEVDPTTKLPQVKLSLDADVSGKILRLVVDIKTVIKGN